MRDEDGLFSIVEGEAELTKKEMGQREMTDDGELMQASEHPPCFLWNRPRM